MNAHTALAALKIDLHDLPTWDSYRKASPEQRSIIHAAWEKIGRDRKHPQADQAWRLHTLAITHSHRGYHVAVGDGPFETKHQTYDGQPMELDGWKEHSL